MNEHLRSLSYQDGGRVIPRARKRGPVNGRVPALPRPERWCSVMQRACQESPIPSDKGACVGCGRKLPPGPVAN